MQSVVQNRLHWKYIRSNVVIFIGGLLSERNQYMLTDIVKLVMLFDEIIDFSISQTTLPCCLQQIVFRHIRQKKWKIHLRNKLITLYVDYIVCFCSFSCCLQIKVYFMTRATYDTKGENELDFDKNTVFSQGYSGVYNAMQPLYSNLNNFSCIYHTILIYQF